MNSHMADNQFCWTFFKCEKVHCPVYQNKHTRCWLTDDTQCHDEIQGRFIDKLEMCLNCEFFKIGINLHNIEKTCQMISRSYAEKCKKLQQQDQELEDVSMEMALGLSEVFVALKRLAAGDPEVRMAEDSSLEIIAKLKQLVNRTAENLAEIVDLSHEFAIGLAEHFDVMHRVAGGDLNARITGSSDVELLESLKKITNQMIDSVAQEIANRRQAQERLRQSEEQFRTFAEKAPVGISIMNADQVFDYFNPTFTDITGYTIDDLPDKQTWFQKAYPDPQYRDRIKSLWHKTHLSGHPEGKYQSQTLNVRCMDGRDKIIVFRTSVLKDGKHFVTYSDITEKAKAEEEKRHLEDRLQRSQKMEAIGTLAGGVAHDLNNILSGLVSYPDLLLFDLPEDSPMRKPIQTIRTSGQKAAAIVQDLLTLARRNIAAREVINLNQVISEYLNSLEYEQLRQLHAGIGIQTSLDNHLLNLMGSKVHLFKTLMNLVSNAADSMPNGGIAHIRTFNRYLDQPLQLYDDIREGDYVVLEVADNGVGISAEDLQRIFEPFYTKKVMGRGGTGLGMAVVWGTVRDHRGYINVQSAPAAGTRFTLYFPVTRESLEHDVPIADMGQFKGRGESILVVDDVEEQRIIASQMLTRLGYHVVAVASGEDAVAFVREHPVDLLVLDMIMTPGMDGLETYKQIVALRPGQKAIVASGFSESVRYWAAQSLGAGAYIKKPYTLEKIGQAVRAELDKLG